jgi:Flp pilus assembly secretin CpaC
LTPASQAVGIQGLQAARVGGAAKSQIQNVLGFLADGFSQQFQVSGDNAAVNGVLQILESRGIARALSNPSLTVLSGESASFQVGGEVPIPQAFSPAMGANTGTNATTPGVFSSVEFRSFGVELTMRPMVGDDDKVTLSLSSVVDQPDEQLTTLIRDTTGTAPTTTAFQSRSIQTTTRLSDGQALLIGGLIARRATDGASYTPGLERVPLVGWLFKRFSVKDEDRELVVVVSPTVVRDRIMDMGGWDFPDVSKLSRRWVDETIRWCREQWPVATGRKPAAASRAKEAGR